MRPPPGRKTHRRRSWLLILLLFFCALGIAIGVGALLVGSWKRPLTALLAIAVGVALRWRYSARGRQLKHGEERLAFYATVLAGVVGEAFSEVVVGPSADTFLWQLVYVVGIGAPIGLAMWMGTWMLAEMVAVTGLLVKRDPAT